MSRSERFMKHLPAVWHAIRIFGKPFTAHDIALLSSVKPGLARKYIVRLAHRIPKHLVRTKQRDANKRQYWKLVRDPGARVPKVGARLTDAMQRQCQSPECVLHAGHVTEELHLNAYGHRYGKEVSRAD